MIFEPLTLATQYELIGNANTVDNAILVACGNGRSANSFVHITNPAGNTRVASILVPGNDIVIVKKERNQKIFASTGAGGGGAGAAINFTKVGFNN